MDATAVPSTRSIESLHAAAMFAGVKKYTAIKSSSNTPEANHVTVNPSFVFVVPVPFARRNAEGGVRRNNVRTGLVPRAIELVPSSSTDHRR